MNIYDIAKLSGVSYATVSRVINNKDGVKKETREKVKKILDEYDYLPNFFARGLAKNSMKIIGIILIDVRNIHHTNIAFDVEKQLSQFGYTSIVGNCGMDKTKREAYLRVMAGRVDGIVLIGSGFQEDTTKKSIEKYFTDKPVVMSNGYLNLENICGIILDERKAISDVVGYFADRGHRNIAFVNDYITYSSRQKQEGFMDGIRDNNILFNERNIINIETDLDTSEVEIQKLLQLNKNITAIVCSEDIMAVGGIKACNNLKLNVPKDINIVGFNNSIYSDISTPKISSVDNKIHDMSKKCSEALYYMLMKEKVDPIFTIIPEFVVKQSTN